LPIEQDQLVFIELDLACERNKLNKMLFWNTGQETMLS
jgi:hypothetical protein